MNRKEEITGIITEKIIAGLISEGISNHVFPGCVVGYGNDKYFKVIKEGRFIYSSDGSKVDATTIYDIASLTKIVTTTGILVLNTKQQLSLDDPIDKYLNVLSFPTVTIRHILAHTGGLTLSLSSLKNLSNEEIDATILNTGPTSKPGEKIYYSNQGFYILGKVIESITGQTLAHFFQKSIFDPLEMTDTQSNPPALLKNRIAPTENDEWRKKIVWGEPHDETAYRMGVLCGHAGLFSTTQDLFKLGILWLSMGNYKDRTIISPELILEATCSNFPEAENTTGDYNHNFALGWRLNDRKFIGNRASTVTYNFSGFTGPSLMVDPEKNLVLVVMNNRVYPSRLTSTNRALYHAKITDEVYTALSL